MKRPVRKLALRRDTLRSLQAGQLSRAAGGIQTLSDLVCPPSWMHTCGDSCTADLRTG